MNLTEYCAHMREQIAKFESRYTRCVALDAENWPPTAGVEDWDDAYATTMEVNDEEFEMDFTPEAAADRNRFKKILALDEETAR